jgi:hypothetical protein
MRFKEQRRSAMSDYQMLSKGGVPESRKFKPLAKSGAVNLEGSVRSRARRCLEAGR